MSDIDTEKTVEVRLDAIAAELHGHGGVDLAYMPDLKDMVLLASADAAGVSIQNGELIFQSIETRNQYAAAHYFRELKRNEAPALDWLKEAGEIWRKEYSLKDKVSGRLLALRHEEEDILISASRALKARLIDSFEILQLIEIAIPHLKNLEAFSLKAFFEAYEEGSKANPASALFSYAIEARLEKDQTLCSAIIHLVREEISVGNASLYVMASIISAKKNPEDIAEKILQDSKSDKDILRANSLWVLGKLIALERLPLSSFQKASDTLLEGTRSANGDIRHKAISGVAQAALVFEDLSDELSKAAEAGDVAMLEAIASLMLTDRDRIKAHGHRRRWILALAKLPITSRVALNHYDFVVAELINEGLIDLALMSLESWISGAAPEIRGDNRATELLDSTFHKIASKPELRSRLITSWLVADNYSIVNSIDDFLSYIGVHGVKDLEFSKDFIDHMDNEELVLLIRRMLGIIVDEYHLTSLTLSLLNTRDFEKRTLPYVGSLFEAEIGIDFPDYVITHLDELKLKTEERSIQEMCDCVTKKLRAYLAALEGIPKLVELRSSMRIEQEFSKARSKEMAKHQKKAEEKSIIRKLATTIPLKAGIASFSYHENGYSDASNLHTFSTSVMLPRRSVLDAVGYDIQRFFFRTAELGEK